MSMQYTLDDLHKMSWRDFETAAVGAVRRLYSNYEIEVSNTPFSKDGGKDGEVQHILAIGLGPELAISIKVFLEIKKRNERARVNKSDIGSHVVDAFRNKVTKVIFITNRQFTKPLSQWLTEFCGPLNIQFSLVPGSVLLEWLNRPDSISGKRSAFIESHSASPETSDKDAAAIYGRLTYTLDPNEAVGGTAPCNGRADRPVFAIIDLVVGDALSPFHGVIDFVSKQAGAATIHDTAGRKAVIFSPGDRHRWVFAIWPNRTGQWDDSCFEISLEQVGIPFIVQSTNVFYFPEQALGVALARPQNDAEAAIRRRLGDWRTLGGLSLNILLSPGGLGKSFIVGRLRKEWQAQGVREVVLDGETVGDDGKLIERTFSGLFPFPKSPFDDGAKPALIRWLSVFNLSPDVCETVANDLCGPNGLRPNQYSASLRAEMFAALLSEGGAERGLVFVLEDLHKVSPSVLSVLQEALTLLRARGRGNILVLLTSRPAREGVGLDITADWLSRLKELSSLAEDAFNEILPLSEQDAREILRRTVPSLEVAHVHEIVEQVGTTPFNLREAVLYLRQVEVLQILEPGGRPILGDPAGLNRLLKHERLRQTTRQRLEVFFGSQPPSLRKLVEAGACYGRQFPFPLVVRAGGVLDREQAIEAIGQASRWSLMAVSPDRRENLEFDHDLVRSAVLGLMPDLRRREIAEALLNAVENTGEETVRIAALAYQAGYADKAFDLATLAAREQNERGRPADALKANYIALLTLDPKWTSKFEKQSFSWGDLAILSAPPSRREFNDWRERDRTALTVLRDNLRCLGTVSAGSSSLSDSILTEARLLTDRLGDRAGSASLIAMEGRLLFERNDILGALKAHEEAERMFADLPKEDSSDRADNLVRLAICLRQLGKINDSLSTLRRALKYRVKSDWTLVNKVRSNTGAAYLLSDWNQVRYHWERQIRSARRHGLVARQAHALVGLSFINLFDGRQAEGRRQAEEALEIAKTQGLQNTRVRCDLNLSVSSLMDGNLDGALNYLYEAESIAIKHQIGRRLWRVYANLATTYELSNEAEKARARDVQTLTSLQAETWEGDSVTLLQRGRNFLPLVNIAFRAALAPDLYDPVLRRLRPETVLIAQDTAKELVAGENSFLDGVLLKYLVNFNGQPRFLLTE